MNTIHRRSFLKSTMLGAAAIGLSPRSWANVPGANSDIRVAVVGFGGQGRSHIEGFRRLEGVRVVALCDCDRQILAAGVEAFTKRNEMVTGYVDVRELLDDRRVDAISLATPNHWHALPTIWACQAGKDVYVEKPVSHNVWEGRQAVEAARKYNRIVQTGTQSRSSHGIQQAVDWVREGNLGKITVARGLCYKARRSIGKVDGPQPIPSQIDYDLWCGPAPLVPLRRRRLHYDWHWVWDTGNGDLGNQGIHQMDIARWFLGVEELSPSVFSVGGRLGYDDDGETPNTQFVFHDYPQAPLIFEVRGLPTSRESQTDQAWNRNMDRYKGADVGDVIHCEGGYVVVPSYTTAIAHDNNGTEIRKWSGATSHHQNFIQAVRSRKSAELTADILEGHLSSALCHTGNISHVLGARSRPETIRESIQSSQPALEIFERMADHLLANGVDLHTTPLTLGPVLRMDPNRELFLGDQVANALLTRNYRDPYVVPKNV
jgi:predicted dehydrogenase